MDLVHMELSAAERKDQMPTAEPPTGPRYPYGLRVSLEDEALTKLGLPALPGTEQTLMLHAKVTVVAVSSTEDERGKSRRLELQITDLALAPETPTPALETRLYGGGA